MLIPGSLPQAILPRHYQILRQVKKELKEMLCIQSYLFLCLCAFCSSLCLCATAFSLFLLRSYASGLRQIAQSSSPITVSCSSASSPGILSSCRETGTSLMISSARDTNGKSSCTHGINLAKRLFDELDSLEQVFLFDDQGRCESNAGM